MLLRLLQPAYAAVVATSLYVAVCPVVLAQVPHPGLRSDSLRISSSDSVLSTSSRYIHRGTISVIVDGFGTLSDSSDYTVDAVRGRITLSSAFRTRLEAVPAGATAVIRYRTLPIVLQDSYHAPAAERITSAGRPFVAPTPRPPVETNEWFGRGLQRSGMIVRGLSVGTNRDASLTSGLRLQLSGSLSEDVNVVAALTDENSPLQPEGTTQTLREVDRVFIDISGRSYALTLGDFVYARDRKQGGAFGALSRKFQGAQAIVRDWTSPVPDLRATVGVVGASARGKFHTLRFQGTEGNQGPFRLTGKNGEPRVIVIAGSERVTINGEPMVRGEVQDYVIDYASGEVLFTSRRPITSASRIVVDFEYADRQYARNAIGASLDAVWRDSTIILTSGVLQEADDPDAPLDLGLTDELRAMLRMSGADRFKASLSSARDVGIDTATGRGVGQYRRVDTLIAGRMYAIYRYAPGDPSALYAITFSPVERMPSDSAGYVRVSAGEYRFAGVGAGSYLPLQFIPIPQLQRTAHVSVQARPMTGVAIMADLAGSVFDRNRLSSLDDQNNAGHAGQLALDLSSGQLTPGGIDVGRFTLSLSHRAVSSTFVAPDRIDAAEYERQWDLPGTRAVDERRTEARVGYVPRPWIRSEAFTGTVTRTGEVSSVRSGGSMILQDSAGARLGAEIERVSRDLATTSTHSFWTRHGVSGELPLGSWRPGIRFTTEDRADRFVPADSLLDGSFRAVEWAPWVTWQPNQMFSGRAEVQVRAEDSSFAGARRHAFNAFTQSYSAEAQPWESVHSSLALNVRQTTFTEEFRRRGNGDATTLLVRSHTRAATMRREVEGDLLYEFSNQRSSRLERVFVRVARGTGNYRYLGDTNGNGISDEGEYELVRFDGDFVALLLPGEALVPVNDVKASARIRWNGARAAGAERPAWLRALSTETLVRVEERSSDSRSANVYGLRWKTFLSGATTLSGQQVVTQDVHLFEGDPAFSARARVTERRALTQLVTSPERSYGNERSLRVRTRLSSELGQQTDVWVRRDRMLSDGVNPRERDITAVGGTYDMTMRLDRRLEAGWSIGLGSNIDRRGDREVEATTNEQAVRLTFGMPLTGQVRAELRREEATLASSTGIIPAVVPFELTDGRAVGRSWLWRLSGDAQLTSLIQMSIEYFGRQEGTSPVVHTARVEARAVF